MIKHLSTEAILAFNQQVLATHGGDTGLTGRALLESAVAATKATFGGEPILSDVIEMAAAYLYYLCKNNPFVDGKKPTAWARFLVFLSENGHLASKNLDVDVWQQFHLKVTRLDGHRSRATIMLRLLLAVRS